MRKSSQGSFVDAWYHLAMLTKIAMLYSTDENKAQRYLYHLVLYQSNITENHPEMDPTPNHHMAFHVPKQLRAYGPANFLAAWHFEQINRILQKVPTNKKLIITSVQVSDYSLGTDQMDYSMLKHVG
ncbi:hypothetical protein MJO28_014640 [Puccinia striiformis f. sp. tritici]|uniref:Uncharacterized protein n=1 Tax=Puccinia striiformis f. sp. tritici TaxID=168172 RepID=A0ACC0DUQ9_9BASI|nr:hypothetical protein MJO28_014640 [Puccinia striiformis f. sp. tritici]